MPFGKVVYKGETVLEMNFECWTIKPLNGRSSNKTNGHFHKARFSFMGKQSETTSIVIKCKHLKKTHIRFDCFEKPNVCSWAISESAFYKIFQKTPEDRRNYSFVPYETGKSRLDKCQTARAGHLKIKTKDNTKQETTGERFIFSKWLGD